MKLKGSQHPIAQYLVRANTPPQERFRVDIIWKQYVLGPQEAVVNIAPEISQRSDYSRQLDVFVKICLSCSG